MQRADSKRPLREGRFRGRLGHGALLAALLHLQILAPLLVLTFIYAAREEAERPDEVDVAFREATPEELPADLPSLDDELPPPAPPEAPDRRKKRPERAVAETRPEPDVPLPPTPVIPEEQPPPPAPEERRPNQKMVDLDNDKDVEPPPDAKYLAQKNNRAEVETRATDTNLNQAQKGTTETSSPSDRQDQEPGDESTRVAELETQKSALGKKAPDVTPHADPQPAQSPADSVRPKSLLSLRDSDRREHDITPETADPSLPRTPEGRLARPDDRDRHDHGALSPSEKKVRLQLTGTDYEHLFGADAAAERRIAQTERSKKQGKFQKRLGRLQSALENFIPEVQPGNQTALNTRAAPFAAYITRMHRSIHRLWGFGMLEDWDELSGSSPLNNPELLTTLELVLNGDGSVDKVTIVRASGYLPYDAAAIDVAYSAGPFPDPPRAIRSGNGKIYVHWRFHRDGRQCATSGADYFILKNAPAGDVVAKESGARGDGDGSSSEGDGSEDGPRRLERRSGGERVARGDGHETPGGSAPRGAAPAESASVVRAENPAARLVAEGWFDALGRGDIKGMLGRAAYPFRSSGGVAASSGAELANMLRALVEELPASSREASIRVFTTAGLRGAMGRLPPGLDDGSGMLFAVSAPSRTETFVLALAQRPGGWKAVGFIRR